MLHRDEITSARYGRCDPAALSTTFDRSVFNGLSRTSFPYLPLSLLELHPRAGARNLRINLASNFDAPLYTESISPGRSSGVHQITRDESLDMITGAIDELLSTFQIVCREKGSPVRKPSLVLLLFVYTWPFGILIEFQ